MIRGCDYSLARPDPKKLKAAGFQFACRYLTNGGLNGKALSPAELVALRSAGLAVVLNFEESGSFGTGYTGGRADALKAQDARIKLGLPASVIYFSCEANARFDLAYLRGAASVLGKGNTGAYVVQAHAKEVLDAGYWCWEACWGCPDRSFDPRAQLRQVLGGQPFDGVPDAIDIDVATVDNYGQVGGDMSLTPEEHLWLAHCNGWAMGPGQLLTPDAIAAAVVAKLPPGQGADASAIAAAVAAELRKHPLAPAP